MGKPRKPRSDAKMYQLPKDILHSVNERLVDCNMSYTDIRAWLAEKGYTISQSSLSRYAFKVFDAAQRIADNLEKTKAVVDFIGRNPDLDTTAAIKRKAELAFDQMEEGLLAAIKQHPELASDLKNILSRAREQVVADVDV